jgi:hypothetical protein
LGDFIGSNFSRAVGSIESSTRDTGRVHTSDA